MSSFLIDERMMGAGLGLQGCELILFAWIASYTNVGKTMYMSQLTLATKMGYSREHIGRSLRQLAERGLISRLGYHADSDSYEYVANKDVMRQILPARDKKSQPNETYHPNPMEDTIVPDCDYLSQNNINHNKPDNKGDNDILPIFENLVLNNKWEALLTIPTWKNKSQASLDEAIALLKQYPSEIGIEMLRHTIAGEYREIDPPTKEMIAAASSSKATATPKTAESDLEIAIFRDILALVPKDKRELVFETGNKGAKYGRSLFVEAKEHQIMVYYPGTMTNWIEDKRKEIISAINSHITEGMISFIALD